MVSIHIRGYEPTDIEAVSEIMSAPRVIPGTLQLPYRSVEWRRDRYSAPRPGTHSLVAEVDGRVVGHLGLTIEAPERRRHVGAIGMAVHDEFQGQGVGSALMEAAIELADRWLNLTRIELTVFADNEAAVGLYKKFGFEIEGTAKSYAFRDGEMGDAYYMGRVRD
jgi:putative acetyltransferase